MRGAPPPPRECCRPLLTAVRVCVCARGSAAAAAPAYSGPFDCLRRSVAAEGVGVLYRGHAATVMREVRAARALNHRHNGAR